MHIPQFLGMFSCVHATARYLGDVSATLLRAIAALAVIGPLFLWSALRTRTGRPGGRLQLLGASGLLIVVVAHLCEGLRLFPGMGWGRPQSAGHYLDMSAAIVGLVFVPLGYLLGRRGSLVGRARSRGN